MLRRSTQNLLCALGFVGGIAIRSWFEIPLIAGFALACAGIVTSILGWKRERVRIGGLIALFLFLGIGRTDAALRPLPESDISHWAGQTVEVEGVVAYDPEIRLKTQKVVVEQLLPLAPFQKSGEVVNVDYIYEQPPAELYADLLPRYVEVQVFRALLESAAAEHAARMTAMESATNNAGEMIDRLTLNMNRIRQASITKELIEVVSGAAAL